MCPVHISVTICITKTKSDIETLMPIKNVFEVSDLDFSEFKFWCCHNAKMLLVIRQPYEIFCYKNMCI